MKQKWILRIFAALIAAAFLSCTGFFEQEEEIEDFGRNKPSQGSPTPTSTTRVFFDNSGNNCSVDVFANSSRESKIVPTVSAKQQSGNVDWVQAENGYEFYFIYNISISGATFPYTHNKGFVTTVIPKDSTTKVVIQPLANIVTNPNEALFTDCIITVRNNNASAIRLLRGNSVVKPLSGTDLIGNGTTAAYKINPSDKVSDYKINLQGENIPLSTTLPAFQSGYLYEITLYNANDVRSQSKPLTRNGLNL